LSPIAEALIERRTLFSTILGSILLLSDGALVYDLYASVAAAGREIAGGDGRVRVSAGARRA